MESEVSDRQAVVGDQRMNVEWKWIRNSGQDRMRQSFRLSAVADDPSVEMSRRRARRPQPARKARWNTRPQMKAVGEIGGMMDDQGFPSDVGRGHVRRNGMKGNCSHHLR
jgi:hypothetical protein